MRAILLLALLSQLVWANGYACIKHDYDLSEREKVIFLFSTFDISKKDGYLNYDEIELFQRLTDPQLPLDIPTYRYVVKLLGGNVRHGVNLEQFNSSYYIHRNTLGTDLHKDYMIISRIIRGAM
jgi:hypothetical protein